MKLTLMAAVPCKRFDFSPPAKDGRGGWTFSQFSANRYVASPADLGIKLGLAVWATPSVEADYVEWSELVAYRGNLLLGTDRLDWKQPNNGGTHHSSGSVYEWIQAIDAPIDSDGLIQVFIRVKLKSQEAPIHVDGSPLVHVTCQDTNDMLLSDEDYAKAVNDRKQTWTW